MARIEFGEFRTNDIMRKHINECLDNNWVTMGPKVKLFEEKFAEQLNYKHAVMTSSGTTADTTACLSLYDYGAREGDGVICPALAFIASANSILAARLRPTFVDVRRETLNLNEDLVEKAITPRTRAIMAVNTMGKPCKLDRLREICNKHNLVLIVDNCEGHLCKYQGKYSGEYADITTYSAYIAHLIVSSEAGLVCTNHSSLPPIFRSIRSHGRHDGSLYFDHERVGYNFKPTDLTASIGLGEVDQVHETFKIRKNNWYYLTEHCGFLRELGWLSEEDPGDDNCPHGFSFTCKAPEHFPLLTQILDQYDIHWKRNFGCISTQHKAYSWYNGPRFDEAEWVGNYGLHIGVHKYLSNNDLDRIVKAFTVFKESV